MTSTHATSGPLALAAWLAIAAGPATTLPADTPDQGPKCGTPAATQPAPSSRTPMPMGLGSDTAYPPGVGAPVLVPAVLPSELGTRGGAASPILPSPTGVSSLPPTGAPPPAVPGLPPAKDKKKEDRSNRPRVEAIQAQGQVPEERLLDVGVEIFDPGAQENDREKLARRGLSPELRRSEARYISYHLKKTLEGTGNWGAVRVLPGPGEGLDVTVSGRILDSNGKHLTLDIDARDATGRPWVLKRYRGEADTSAYSGERPAPPEPFQAVYNRIANDLLAGRDDLDADELVEVRRVSSMRFAAQLAPEAFGSHLKTKGSSRFTLVRFPAEDDPMLRRVASIRERDQMFVDTLNDHYLSFYERMSEPYTSWRKNSYEEQDTLDRIKRESLLKKILGGAAILIGMTMTPDNQGEQMARDAAILGGSLALQAGFQQAQEKGVHEAALKELATSFDAETAPLLVEVEGQQLRLTGSAETQFAAWRELLRQMFALETGTPSDPNAVVVGGPRSSH
jgi:hypothetical protein